MLLDIFLKTWGVATVNFLENETTAKGYEPAHDAFQRTYSIHSLRNLPISIGELETSTVRMHDFKFYIRHYSEYF